MDKKELNLINKSLSSELSESEQKEFHSWKEKEENKNLYSLIDSIRIDENVDREAENMRFSILDDIHHRMDTSKRKFIRLKTISIAASIALLVGISGFFFYQAGFNRISNQIVTMSNPSGAKSEITLPDGSTVVLHGGSTLSYPAIFANNSRQVHLIGEAYFKVKRDEKAPFTVQAEKVNIKVLGTTFNIEAYEEDESVYVTLQSGKVSMSVDDYDGELILTPNQQAVYNKQTQDILKRNVNAEEITGWTRNHIYFNATSLKEIARKLEHHFNVDISISSQKLEKILYTGEFLENESIDDILNVLSMDDRIKYTRENNKIIIYE